jgi:hypothetical protein
MIVLYIILGLIALLLLLAAMRPNTMVVQRSATINAPAEKIFPLINDFHEWMKWSPWEKLDPNLKRTYGGSPSGKGANYAWVGSRKVGEGRMEIMDTQPPNTVTIKLNFIKPWEAESATVFTLTPAGGGTNVNWHMTSSANYMSKLFGLLFNMDKMIGKDFEKGLAAMKEAAEK